MSEAASSERSLGSSTGLLLAGRLVGNAGYFVAVLIVARSLGPEGRGAIAFVTVTALVAAAVAALGAPSAVSVLVHERADKRAELLTASVALTTVTGLGAGIIAFGGMLGLGVGPAGIGDGLITACVPAAMFLALFDLCVTLLLALGRPAMFAVIVGLAPWLYAAGLVAVGLHSELTITSAVVVWLVSIGVASLIPVALSARAVGIGRLELEIVRKTSSFGFKAWVGGLAGSLNFRLDQVLMGLITTEAALGVYALAVNASEILLYVPAIVGMLLIPRIAQTAPEHRHAEVTRVFRISLLVTGVAAAVAAAAGPFAIPLVFGDEFRPSVVPFLALLPGAAGFTAMRVFSSALVGSSRPGRSSVGPVVALLVGVGLDLALIPSFGATGAAWAASGALLAGGVAALSIYRHETPFSLTAVIPGSADVGDSIRVATRLARR